MNPLETTPAPTLSRRMLLMGVGAAGVATTLAGFPLTASAAAAESLQDILDISATAEMFGVTFLGTALDSAKAGHYTKPIPDAVLAILTAARAQEQFHLDFFRGLGGRALTQTFTPAPANFTDQTVFFTSLAQEEEREIAAQLAAFKSFVALGRTDLVKGTFQYAAEEAEHRVLANYALGVRPPNDRAFEPVLYNTVADFLAALKGLGIIGGTGTPITYPGPGAIDPTNVIERTPGGPSVSCTAAAPTMPTRLPNTGGLPIWPVLAAGAGLALLGGGIRQAAASRATGTGASSDPEPPAS